MSKKAFVALVTCFNEDEALNYTATRAQARRQIEAGNHLLVAGTNGDFSALTFEEKIHLTEEVVDEASGKVDIFVNAGMPSTFETIRLAKAFDQIGVDAIAVITPFFIEVTQEGLVRHFTAIADAVSTPIYLYDIPARTQNHIEPETAALLAKHPNIAGIKDSGGKQDVLQAYMNVAHNSDGFDVYSGPDHLVLWALQNGAAGCISGLGNVMPHILADIVRAFNAGDEAKAEAAQKTYADFRSDLYGLGYPPAMVKRALWIMDNSVGASRQPALLPDPDQDRQIEVILNKYGLVS